MRPYKWVIHLLLLSLVAGVLAACNTSPEPDSQVQMTLTPETVTLKPLETFTFEMVVTGTDNTAVTWTMTGGAVMETSGAVTYTAPAETGTYTLTATSVVDPDCSASATITVTSDPEPNTEVEMTLEPATVTLLPLETQVFTATVTGTDNTAVTWAVTGGVLDGSGTTVTYTAPAEAGAYTLTATSVADTSCNASAVITVNPEPASGLVKLLASDAQAEDLFGHSLAVAGDTLVVGAPRSDAAAEDAGTVYVFEKRAGVWQEQQRLSASDGQVGDLFGWSVDVSIDTLVVGNLAEPGSSVYSYTKQADTWAEVQRLDSGGNQDNFGRTLALDGDTLLVSADREDTVAEDAGTVYVYTREGDLWTKQQKLSASDGALKERFGFAVDLYGETALIGAHGYEGLGPLTGYAYVFKKEGDTWAEQQKLETLPFIDGDHFGHAVALNKDSLFIAANRDDYPDKDSGSVHVFTQVEETWTRQTRLNSGSPADNQLFGHALAATDDALAVTALSEPGTVNVLEAEAPWAGQSAVSVQDVAFGQAVDLSGQTLAVGAFHDAELGVKAGAVYLTELTP